MEFWERWLTQAFEHLIPKISLLLLVWILITMGANEMRSLHTKYRVGKAHMMAAV